METVRANAWSTEAKNGWRYVEFGSYCPCCGEFNFTEAAIEGEDSDPEAYYNVTCSSCDEEYEVEV